MDNRSIWYPLLNGGRVGLLFTGLILILSGLFVISQSALGYFLPHDVSFIGLTADELSAFQGGRITLFMFHDRVAFGGSIMAVGMLYLWLVEFPLKNGQGWSWWVLALSGFVGFGSFLTYLGYGYLDTWHGVGTLLLIPIFSLGLIISYRRLSADQRPISVLKSGRNLPNLTTRAGLGTGLLLFIALGLLAGGMTIMLIGMTVVFVPQDLAYMQVPMCASLDEINPRLVPLIAHDRACFGGGLATIGLIMGFSVYHTNARRSLWETLAIALTVGFASAITVHFLIGYTDLLHLAPAYAGVIVYTIGLIWTYQSWCKGNNAALITSKAEELS